MAKGCWIARVDVESPEQYQAEYVRNNGPVFSNYVARFLVRAGRFENPEGTSGSRNVVLEFPSCQATLECHNSAEYRSILAIRKAHSIGDIVIVEGYDGPQPGMSP